MDHQGRSYYRLQREGAMIQFTPLASSSSGNCYVVSDGKTKIMIDVGISWKQVQRTLEFKTSEIEAVLLSHSHGDHAKHVKEAMKAGKDVYTSPQTISTLKLEGHHVKAVDPLQQFRIGTWIIKTLPAHHDAEGTYSFLLANQQRESLIFITDSYYCSYKFKDLHMIAIECNYSIKLLDANIANGSVPAVMRSRLLRSHFSLEHVKEFLRANDLSKLREVHLMHLSDNNSDEELFRREIRELVGKPVYVCKK